MSEKPSSAEGPYKANKHGDISWPGGMTNFYCTYEPKEVAFTVRMLNEAYEAGRQSIQPLLDEQKAKWEKLREIITELNKQTDVDLKWRATLAVVLQKMTELDAETLRQSVLDEQKEKK